MFARNILEKVIKHEQKYSQSNSLNAQKKINLITLFIKKNPIVFQIVINILNVPFISLFINHHKNKYQPSIQEKMFALDFINYVVVHNPVIPYKYFPKKDYQAIYHFIWNKCLIALFDILNLHHLLDKQTENLYFKHQKLSKKNKPKFRLTHWEHLGFKSVIHHFEPSIFIEKYGISKILKGNKVHGKTIIDCGAFIGDSSYIFAKYLHPTKVIAIEPDNTNFEFLQRNILLNCLTNVHPYKYAVSSRNNKKYTMNASGSSAAHFSLENNKQSSTYTVTIDSLIHRHSINNVALIKMDIEGEELNAILGAKYVIKKFKPILIVSIYHKGYDLFKIPEILKKFVNDYRFRFLNLNPMSATTERVLIAE